MNPTATAMMMKASERQRAQKPTWDHACDHEGARSASLPGFKRDPAPADPPCTRGRPKPPSDEDGPEEVDRVAEDLNEVATGTNDDDAAARNPAEEGRDGRVYGGCPHSGTGSPGTLFCRPRAAAKTAMPSSLEGERSTTPTAPAWWKQAATL